MYRYSFWGGRGNNRLIVNCITSFLFLKSLWTQNMELRLAYGHIMACVACTSYRWADTTCLVYVSSAHPPSFAILQWHLIRTLWP